ncbi:sugar dehydrogenase complex small subunit [Sphingomonas abietis]|uniref:Sugar dehydrogenase complex small subunit n=1 Tax=Sphingomonas abietis TaxID=3012344 RepID=A0ABY7NL42_9SPHN|nr:sugar dehydrogenase complex small subunit [Sphingomonas abietis]WBO21343.1 sugar dehydrogenase complex small subunit [Sphingomonas abietis]
MADPSETTATTRRAVLTGAAIATVVAAIPSLARSDATAPATDESEADFAQISRFLTGKPDLDGDIQRRLLGAFLSRDAAFAQKLRALAPFTRQAGQTPQTLPARLVAEAADLADLPAQILGGWYLGIVGAGKDALCVTYTGALANRAVADVLAPPSYAYGVYGSWQVRPE